EKYQKIAEHLMGNVIIANNLANATAIAEKTNRKFRVVTLDGDVVFPCGSMSGGAKSKTKQSLFTREKEITTLETKLHEYKERRSVIIEKVDEKRKGIVLLENAVVQAEKELQRNNDAFQITRASPN